MSCCPRKGSYCVQAFKLVRVDIENKCCVYLSVGPIIYYYLSRSLVTPKCVHLHGHTIKREAKNGNILLINLIILPLALLIRKNTFRLRSARIKTANNNRGQHYRFFPILHSFCWSVCVKWLKWTIDMCTRWHGDRAEYLAR